MIKYHTIRTGHCREVKYQESRYERDRGGDMFACRPNGLHQPQAGTSTGSAERERTVASSSVKDRPDPACRAACGVGPAG
jgi:hypothetical protein